MELVSVIVPVFNAETTLTDCLQSLSRQTYPRLEVFLVDDGSTDRSVEVCRAFAEQDGRFTVLENPHRGVSHARNAGLDRASGAYVSFLDADDTVPPDFLERLVRQVETEQADLCFCGCYENEEPYPVPIDRALCLDREAALYLLFCQPSGFSFAVWNKLFRADRMDGLRFDESLHYLEDGVFVVEYLLRSETMAVLREPLYFHVRRPQSLSRELSPSMERWSAFDARRRMLELAAPVSIRLEHIAKAKRFEGAVYVLFNSYLAGYTDEVYRKRGELKEHIGEFLRFDPIPVTQKIRYLGYTFIINNNLGLSWASRWESLRR